MKFQLTLFFLLAAVVSLAQIAPDKYFVSFTNKSGTPYNVNNPQVFLTQRSIDRRLRQGLTIDETDLPVNPAYITAVKNTGVTLLNATKWLNGVTIYTTDATKITQIEALPFVSGVLKSMKTGSGEIHPDKFLLEKAYNPVVSAMKSVQSGYNYGFSFNQIHMLKGDSLHNKGLRGQGMVIAVLDAGFQNADTVSAFDTLRNEGRLLGTRDFVNPGGNVFPFPISAHGTMVLSCMAGIQPGELIGTAPKASYWLLRSEDADTEYPIEEYNWVTAAEYADSVGADIINSSLGYSTFDDPLSNLNHTCLDMNGHTTVVTRGANMAARKGIAVINSAGNSGGSAWTCVGAPSDGDSVLAIGAVDASGNYALFSSVGVDTAGRVKPNVSAQGQAVYVCGGEGAIITSNGTSFSSPIIAGMVACLWQADYSRSRGDIFNAIQRSANHYTQPDSLTGYGIPDFTKALIILGTNEHPEINRNVVVYPNPFDDGVTVEIPGLKESGYYDLVLYDVLGKRAGEWRVKSAGDVFYLNDLTALSRGTYLLRIYGSGGDFSARLVKR